MQYKNILYEIERILRSPLEVPKVVHEEQIILASFPKSGSTWLRFILSNIARLIGDFAPEVDFYTLDNYSPVVRGNQNLENILVNKELPLFLKTHFPWVSRFRNFSSILLIRNPEDVMISYHHHLVKEVGNKIPEINQFIRHWRYGIPAWVNFHKTWAKQATVIISYEDLVARNYDTVKGLFDIFGYKVPSEIIIDSIQYSSKENMRLILDKKGDPYRKNSTFQFVRKSEMVKDSTLSKDSIQYIEQACQPILDQLFCLKHVSSQSQKTN